MGPIDISPSYIHGVCGWADVEANWRMAAVYLIVYILYDGIHARTM